MGLICVQNRMFWHKLLYEDFSGDGSEAFYFSLTALENGIPQWDLETETWPPWATMVGEEADA